MRVYNLPNTTIRATHNAGSSLLDMAINGDGTRVVLSADEARIHTRAIGLPLAFRRHLNGAIAAAFSPDGSRVCSIGGDASIRLWIASTGVEIWNAADSRQGVRSLAFSPDGSMIAVGMSDSTVTVWNAADGTLLSTFGRYGGAVRMVSFSPDGTLIAAASDDCFARVHDVAKQTTIAAFQHGKAVRVVRWSNAGDRLLTTSNDATARVWQVTPIVLQSDTSDRFSIAPPPPAFVRFVASGDTLNIKETTTITIRTEGSQFLGLADIDSVKLKLGYNSSILFRTTSSVPFTSILDANVPDTSGINRSVQYLVCTVPLDSVDKELFTITFQATLGQDSITRVSFESIDQIGKGPGTRIDKRSDPILIRGICRLGDGPRLYNSLGGPLTITARPLQGGVRIICELAESAPATLNVYDLRGRLIWSDRTNGSEEAARRMERVIPSSVLSGIALATVSTSLQTVSTVVMEGGNP
ncbi:MAG: WD40 repeat domain-containing protein [Candidatus Kapaibacterium sp.]